MPCCNYVRLRNSFATEMDLDMNFIYKSIVSIVILYFSASVHSQGFELSGNNTEYPSVDIYLVCTTPNCDITYEIFKYLGHTNYFENENMNFFLESGGVVIDTESLTHFISRVGKELVYSTSKKIEKIVINRPPEMGVMDAALDCNEDADFTCEDWGSELHTARLMSFLNNMDSITITVDQHLLDSNTRTLAWVANAVLAIPSAKIASALAALGREGLYMIILESVIVASIADQVSQAIEVVSLEVGDEIIINGNGETSIIKNSGGNGGNGGNGGGSVGLIGGATGGSSGGSRKVCTGTADDMRCFTVYY